MKKGILLCIPHTTQTYLKWSKAGSGVISVVGLPSPFAPVENPERFCNKSPSEFYPVHYEIETQFRYETLLGMMMLV